MAKFKISLIVPNNDVSFDQEMNTPAEEYLSSTITDFLDQQAQYKHNKSQQLDAQIITHEVDILSGRYEIYENHDFPFDENVIDAICYAHMRTYYPNGDIEDDEESILITDSMHWEISTYGEQSMCDIIIQDNKVSIDNVYINTSDDTPAHILVLDAIICTTEETISDNPTWEYKHPISYTYNEKLAMHANGQQELTFSMDDKVFTDEEWVENPYARILRTGVQIELQDKYNNRKLFTVNKIQYGFNNISIVYNVSCQDSFTYQLNRQNNGYTLSNDETTTDFIGALDIDHWAAQIAKECYISYEYLPLWQGLYQDENGIYHKFRASDGPIENEVELEDKITNVYKIIKPIYSSKKYPSFYEQYPFSTSGSSANAALIAAGDQIGLQLFVVEGLADFDAENPGKPIKYKKFFYFGPTKNPDVSGLTFSPLRDVQSFALDFSGDSLTTVLNIQSTTWNDQEIGLFPDIPPFFNALFNNKEWKTSTYYPGFFMESVVGKQYGSKTGDIDFIDEDEEHWESDNNYYYIPFLTTIFQAPIVWPYYYNKIRFYWADQKDYTSFATSGNDISALQGNEQICLACKTGGGYDIFLQDQVITHDIVIDEDHEWYIAVKKGDYTGLTLQNFFFILTRDYTDDEVKFAEIADECPWLENKLINLNYFLHQGILSKYEYDGIMDWIFNGLRIINGQLMCAAHAYYTALHERTQKLSQVEIDTDTIGANFYADVVDPYTKTGTISDNISMFIKNYHELFEIEPDSSVDRSILHLNEVISDRFNKYFSADQRFLKHIYNFRQYFNDTNIYSAGASTILDDVNYVVEGDAEDENAFISFSGAMKWERLLRNSNIIHVPEQDGSEDQEEETDPYNGAFVTVPLYQYKTNKYILQKIPGPHTYKEFYIPNIVGGSCVPVENNHIYNAANLYYLTKTKYQSYFGEPRKDKLLDISIQGVSTTCVRLSRQEIIKLFLKNHQNQYYVRDTKIKVPFEWVRTNLEAIKETVSVLSWPGLSYVATINGDKPEYDMEDLDQADQLYKTLAGPLWEIYKNMTPISELFVYDYAIKYRVTETNNSQVYSWYLNDENGHAYIDRNNGYYKKVEKDTEEFVSNDVNDLYKTFYSFPFVSYSTNATSLINNGSNDTTGSLNLISYWVDLTAATKNTKYFVHYEDTTAKGWAIAGGIMFSLLSPLVVPGAGLLSGIAGIVGSIVGGTHQYAHWGKKDSTKYDMSHVIKVNNVYQWSDLQKNTTKSGAKKLGSDIAYKGDSHFVNYVPTEDSELNVRTLTEMWWETRNDSQHPWCTRLDTVSGEAYQYNYKHYFNYYKNIAATYSMGAPKHDSAVSIDIKDNNFSSYDSEYFTVPSTVPTTLTIEDELKFINTHNNFQFDKVWINNRYARFCKVTDGINYKDDYIWVPAEFLKVAPGNSDLQFSLPERFSAIKFYSLVELRENINFTLAYKKEDGSLDRDALEKATWRDYWTRLANSITSTAEHQWSINTLPETGYVKLVATHNGKTMSYYAVHLESFEKLTINSSTQTFSTHSPHLFHINWRQVENKVYNLTTDRELQNNEIVLTSEVGLYYVPEKDSSLIKADEVPNLDWTDLSIHWYVEPDINTRTYTVGQIVATVEQGEEPITDRKYYYLSDTQVSRAEIYNGLHSPVQDKFLVKLRTYHINDEEELVLDDEVIEKAFNIRFSDAYPGDLSTSVDADGNPLEINGHRFEISRLRINRYNIGNMTNGEFWYRFHNRLDLPRIAEKSMMIETQLTTEWEQAYTASHYCQWFIPQYWQEDANSTKNFWQAKIWLVDNKNRVTLSNELIPEVEIYKDGIKTRLDGYLFHYHAGEFDLCGKEEYEIDDIPVVKNNPAITDAINHIFDDLPQNINGRFTIQKYDTCSYYYWSGGGIKHKDLLKKLDVNQKIYSKYDGLYAMQLRLLLTNYVQADTPEYEELCENKLRFWKNLYTRYPGIFLENTYENSNARTSQQLLQMAKTAFMDYTAPEKNYNITVIDAASLDGYEGQELHIGDGILLNTSDYYDAVDETYRALNQYLFITDISYSLRQDTDIALTVNPIKYQDKLLQSIVKLIR